MKVEKHAEQSYSWVCVAVEDGGVEGVAMRYHDSPERALREGVNFAIFKFAPLPREIGSEGYNYES